MDIQELHDFKLGDAIKFHRKLNPKLWHDEHLDPIVRKQLLRIAEDFVEDLGVKLHVKDITVSGSNAAFTYTPHSDLDLHVVVDMKKLPDSDVYRELFQAKKTLYNEVNSIKVRGIPIELYVQDSDVPVRSLGEYSVLNDSWIRSPKKQKASFDQIATKEKYDQLSELVKLAMKTRDLDRINKAIGIVNRYRKAGLHNEGEFSPENLAYKAIRKQGGIDKLYDLRDKLHGQSLSIEEASSREDAIIKINKLRNTSGRSKAEIETINSIIDKMMKQYNIKPKELKNTVDPLSDKIDKARSDKHQAASALKGEWEKFKRGFFAEDEGNPTPTDVENIAAKINKFARQLRVTAELRQLPEAHFPAIELTDLFADNPGTGGGSKVMAELVRLADEAGLNVYLRPSNQGNKIFYSRFGFEKDNDHFGMMVRYPESDSDEEELNEAYTSKQQVIDHFVKNRKYGVPSSTAARQGAVAWERGWRGPKPKPPAVSTPPAKPWLPYKDDLDESLDSKPYSYQQVEKSRWRSMYAFETDKGLTYDVTIRHGVVTFCQVKFMPEHDAYWRSMDITNTGDARRVFATVIDIVKKYVSIHKPDSILFTADEPSRIRLYNAFIKRLDRELPDYEAVNNPTDSTADGWFLLKRKSKKINETAEENQILNLVSKKISKAIVNLMTNKSSEMMQAFFGTPEEVANKIRVQGVYAKELGIPKVQDPVISNVLNKVRFVVVPHRSISLATSEHTLGWYDIRDKEIVINYEKIENYTERNLPKYKDKQLRVSIKRSVTEAFLASTISHELQHAIDDAKSQGLGLKSDNEYLKRQHEINARLQEALLYLSNEMRISADDSRPWLQDQIIRIFREYNLAELYPKNSPEYKRLVSRVYKFFDAERKNPKKETPLSLVQRAINWILGKHTSEIHEDIEKVSSGWRHVGPEYRIDPKTEDYPIYPLPLWTVWQRWHRSKLGSGKDIYRYMDFLMKDWRGMWLPITGSEIADAISKIYGTDPVAGLAEINAEYNTDWTWDELLEILQIERDKRMDRAATMEASGYIPSKKEANDPRFSTALTVDVKPDSIMKNAKAFGSKTSRAGIPPQARPDGKF